MHRPGEEGDQIPNRDMSEAQEGKPSCRGQKIPLRERLRIGGQCGEPGITVGMCVGPWRSA